MPDRETVDRPLPRTASSVSSQIGRELVQVALANAKRLRGRYSCFDNPPSSYQLKLRSRLRQSGLAQRLTMPELLPDIAQQARGITAMYYRLSRPRNFSQLVVHVARHLEWYLDPSLSSNSSLWIWLTAPLLLILTLTCLATYVWRLPADSHLTQALCLIPLMLMLVPLQKMQEEPQDEKAYELYLYLLEAYSDDSAEAKESD